VLDGPHRTRSDRILQGYSSDNQRDASITDQFRVCRDYARRQGWHIVREYSDRAVSDATLLRSGFQAMMAEALQHKVDIVLAESLDRFSRDQEDTAGLFKRLTFLGVRIVTVTEGDITHLHIGLKGTMNALYLKDLADKTRQIGVTREPTGDNKYGDLTAISCQVFREVGNCPMFSDNPLIGKGL
jgi:DNA invertase Pin-like site-specific DNA recombinase